MKIRREILEAQLAEYESQVEGLKSYVIELKAKTTQHGTPSEQFEMDLLEAEHNVSYYKEAIGHIKDEIARLKDGGGESAKPKRLPAGTDTILPRTVKQGIGSFVLSSVSFVAGAILGSKLTQRSESPERQEKGER
jgi:hypothetical protein